MLAQLRSARIPMRGRRRAAQTVCRWAVRVTGARRCHVGVLPTRGRPFVRCTATDTKPTPPCAAGVQGLRRLHTARNPRSALDGATSDLLAGIAAQCRAIAVPSDGVQVLRTPAQFYDTLLDETRRAKGRISLASLYLGTGELEEELVATLKEATATKRDLQLQVVLDHSRGTRQGPDGGASSATKLRPLLEGQAAGSSRERRVSFFQMPELQGTRKANWPARYKEGVAVFHSKAYVFDDTVILSGANLSNDYFTRRQDRYVVFRQAPELAAYFHDLVGELGELSWRLEADGSLTRPEDMDSTTLLLPTATMAARLARFHGPGPQGDGAAALAGLGTNSSKPTDAGGTGGTGGTGGGESRGSVATTLVFPSMQFASAGVRQDQEVTAHLLRGFAPHHRLHVASGYFNFPAEYQRLVLHNDALRGATAPLLSILTASPQANGFWTASQIAAALPLAYSQLERRFYAACSKAGLSAAVRLWEYVRPEWTFHAKGLWLSTAEPQCGAHDKVGSQDPSVTLVGSPNLGRRSVERDLEVAVTLVTTDERLRRALAEERDGLFGDAEEVDDSVWERAERQLSGWSWRAGSWIHLGHRIVAPFL